ncbi:LysE family translocator [Pseudomonas sp. NA-150]|uniref:LysE family translocator n=1 Tax=Pseudomonas sp. NA-150 TaxID=3367525 RepID=UPI0037CA2F26
MIDGPAILTVFFVYLAGVIIPGPNFVAVVHKAVAATRAEALALVGGIVVVNVFWATCAIAGIGVVFKAFPWAALIVKLLGAAYLIWFGSRLVLNAGKRPLAASTAAATVSFRQAFVQGVITNIGNPKSIAFFAAIFSTAAPAHASTGTFLTMLAVVALTSSSWYGMVTLVLSQPRIASAYRRAKKTIDRLCGGLILLLGVRQLVQ